MRPLVRLEAALNALLSQSDEVVGITFGVTVWGLVALSCLFFA